jgi:hypothetical protein
MITRKSAHTPAAILTAAALLAGQPVLANEDGSDDDTPTAAEIRAEELARIQHQNAILMQQAAILKSLGVPETKGETTLGEKAGELEGSIIAAQAVRASARELFKLIDKQTEDRPVLVQTSQSPPFLGGYTILSAKAGQLTEQADALLGQVCSDRVSDASGLFGTASFTPLAAISTALSLLKTDTDVTGFSIDNLDDSLAAAIAGQLSHARVLGGPVLLTPTNPAVKVIDQVLAKKEDLRALLAGDGCTAPPTDAQKQAANSLVGAIDDLVSKALARPSDGGLSLLETAASTADLEIGASEADVNPLVLRIVIDKAGGSVFKRSNLWTALGAEAIAMTGGLTAHYWLNDPTNGKVEAAGIVFCRTQKANFDRVHHSDIRTKCSVT